MRARTDLDRRSTKSIRRNRRAALLAAAVLPLGILLSSCASDSSGSDAPPRGSASAVKDTGSMDLTVAVLNTAMPFTDFFYAVETGLFKKNGLNLKVIPNASAALLPTMGSGDADLALSPTPSALIAAKKGLDTRVVYTTYSFDGLAVLSSKKSIDELKGDGCRIGTSSVGTTGYAVGLQVNKGFGLECDVTPVGGNSIPTLMAGVKSGFFPAVIASWDTALIAMSQDPNLTMLTEPESFTKPPLALPDGPYMWMSAWGSADNLASKATAVRTFLATMQEAEQQLSKASSSEVATVLKGMEFYSGVDIEVLTRSVEYTKHGRTGSQISEAAWTTGLRGYETWGIDGFSADDPTNSYNARVDNTYAPKASS